MDGGTIAATTVRQPGVDYQHLVDKWVHLRGNAAPIFNAEPPVDGCAAVLSRPGNRHRRRTRLRRRLHPAGAAGQRLAALRSIQPVASSRPRARHRHAVLAGPHHLHQGRDRWALCARPPRPRRCPLAPRSTWSDSPSSRDSSPPLSDATFLPLHSRPGRIRHSDHPRTGARGESRLRSGSNRWAADRARSGSQRHRSDRVLGQVHLPCLSAGRRLRSSDLRNPDWKQTAHHGHLLG